MSDHNSIVIKCRLWNVTIGELQADVDVSAGKYGECEFAFTRTTVQGLINKIKEQQDEINSLRSYPRINNNDIV
jgi:C4-type Zn-finger protein